MSNKNIFFIFAILLFLVGCQTVTTEIKEKGNISFEVSSYSLKYEDDSTRDYFSETYKGEGIITVSGDASLAKKSYLVLFEVNKLSGGDKTDISNQTRQVIVSNGMGTFSTHDWNFDKQSKMSKPEYKFKILGYIPFIETNSE